MGAFLEFAGVFEKYRLSKFWEGEGPGFKGLKLKEYCSMNIRSHLPSSWVRFC